MKTYRVDVAPRAEELIDEYIGYILEQSQSPVTAQRVLDRIYAARDSLGTMPRRCPRAPEDESASREIRVKIVQSFLLLFTIDDDNDVVTVVAARHGRQMPLTDL